MKTQRGTAFAIISLFAKEMGVFLVTIHKQKEQIAILLLASNEDLEVTDCLAMRVNGERY
jgi:hypothetical protein